MSTKDQIYQHPQPAPKPFEFNDAVARVFPDMIERSVPGYRLLLELTPILVNRSVQPNSTLYDLGCSLGAATLAARRAIQVPDVRIVGLDNSPDMVRRAQEKIQADNSTVPVEIIEADITQHEFSNASVVLMYFTLQFVPPKHRRALLAKIYAGLNPGGVLVLAEKLAFEDDEQQWMDQHHLDFKRAQGYSDLEIAQKRQAIENVLISQTARDHESALKAAGFGAVYRWLQAFNFSCFVAIKR